MCIKCHSLPRTIGACERVWCRLDSALTNALSTSALGRNELHNKQAGKRPQLTLALDEQPHKKGDHEGET